MKKILLGLFAFSMILFLSACAGSKVVSIVKPEVQASVRIQMKNGATHHGIIFKGDGKHLIYVDAQAHNLDTLRVADISGIRKINTYYDYQADVIPLSEIKHLRKWKRTLLYGGSGLFLGAAAGTGLSIALFSASGNAPAAWLTIAALGGTGAYLFGSKGYQADFDDAVFAARKERAKRMELEQKQKLEELKKEKARLKQLKKEKTRLPNKKQPIH